MNYYMPKSLPKALSYLANGNAFVIAGGTDFFPSLDSRPVPSKLLDLSDINELRGISHQNNRWRFGATTTWTDIVNAELPKCFDGLKACALEVGSLQIQNAGTIAGNLCNASPAADGVPSLLTLDATVELSSLNGVREVALSDFITGVRSIDLHDDELVTAVYVPDFPFNSMGSFLKLGSRKYLVISIVMVGAVISVDADQRISDAKVAVGSCSAIADRLPDLEAVLLGKSALEISCNADIWGAHLGPLTPIADVRGSVEFRLDAAQELCKRAVLQAMVTQDGFNG
jgi:CO/xanthine dehydrogenase FAD-binding subunit